MTTRFRLRHYGAARYDPTKFAPIKDRDFIKPNGGLWTSPIDSTYGWKDWCTDEFFGNLTCHFDIDFEGRVLVINSLKDLDKLPWSQRFSMFPLFEPLLDRYDAIHLTVRGQDETRLTFPRNLYGWDCETVLVMNPACLHSPATAHGAT